MTARVKMISRGPRRPGWPRPKPCLLCNVLRLALGPEDRLHPACRAHVERVESRYADSAAR